MCIMATNNPLFESITTNHWNDYGQHVAFTAYPYNNPEYTALMPAYYVLYGNRYPWQLKEHEPCANHC